MMAQKSTEIREDEMDDQASENQEASSHQESHCDILRFKNSLPVNNLYYFYPSLPFTKKGACSVLTITYKCLLDFDFSLAGRQSEGTTVQVGFGGTKWSGLSARHGQKYEDSS